MEYWKYSKTSLDSDGILKIFEDFPGFRWNIENIPREDEAGIIPERSKIAKHDHTVVFPAHKA